MQSRSHLRVGWMSHHVEGLKPLTAILESGFELAAIITLRDDLLQKRSGSVRYSELARTHGIPFFQIGNVNNPDAVDLLRSLQLDVLFVIGWSQILRAEALETVRLGCFGAHASLLPANRGSAPINWALIKGDEVTGNTLMRLSVDVDAGDIVDQKTICITEFDNVATLYDRVADTNCEMILSVLNNLAQGQSFELKPQADSGEPLLPRRRPDDGRIDWAQPAPKVYDFIRALTRPYPGAFSFSEGKRILFWRSALLPLDMRLADPGTVVGPAVSDTIGANGLVVACATGAVVLLEIEDSEGGVWSGPDLTKYKAKAFENE